MHHVTSQTIKTLPINYPSALPSSATMPSAVGLTSNTPYAGRPGSTIQGGTYTERGTKVCDKCGRTLSLSNFPRWKNKHSEGYQKVCKECQQAMKEGKNIVHVSRIQAAFVRLQDAIGHATMFTLHTVQTLLTEAILDKKDELFRSSLYRFKPKQLINKIVECSEEYEHHKLYHYDERTNDVIDDLGNQLLKDCKDMRTQIFYAIANFYAKQNHPQREVIDIIVFWKYIGEVLKHYLLEFSAMFSRYNLNHAKLYEFAIDDVIINVDALADVTSRQLHYEFPTEETCPHLFTAIDNMHRKVVKFYKERIDGSRQVFCHE